MALQANLTLRVDTVGNGFRGTITRVPVTISSLGTTGAPAALNTNSIGDLGSIQLQPGDCTITLPQAYTQSFPVFYYILVPPTSSINGKILKGNSGDVGLSLVPNLPMVLAVGQGLQSFIVNSLLSETCQAWIV